MNWKYFAGACILAAGLLVKFGAPIGPVALGIGLAALWNWSRHRNAVSPTKNNGV